MSDSTTKLILNDGTVIDNGKAGYSEGFLWCYVTGYTMQQAALLFFDPAKTGKITFEYGAEQDVYEGFTNCINIHIDVDEIIHVCLTRGAENG